MGKNAEQIQVTQHAFLVAWGQFAQEKGLVERLAYVKLRQKTRQHRPQTKINVPSGFAPAGGSRKGAATLSPDSEPGGVGRTAA